MRSRLEWMSGPFLFDEGFLLCFEGRTSEAAHYFALARDKGSREAAVVLASWESAGTPKTIDELHAWADREAASGSACALTWLGDCLGGQEGVRCYQTAAEQGFGRAQGLWGKHLHEVGRFQESSVWLLRGTLQNDVDSFLYLANVMLDTNVVAAKQYFRRAAQLGSYAGQEMFAMLCETKSVTKAIKWYAAAASQLNSPDCNCAKRFSEIAADVFARFTAPGLKTPELYRQMRTVAVVAEPHLRRASKKARTDNAEAALVFWGGVEVPVCVAECIRWYKDILKRVQAAVLCFLGIATRQRHWPPEVALMIARCVWKSKKEPIVWSSCE